MPRMPVVRTPISMLDFARALIRTLRVTGTTPTKAAAGVLWAQYALETGAGGFCWNHNLFNHKVTQEQAAAGVPYMMLANTWEVVDGQRVLFQPPHPATWFRAFASFEAAMSHHITAIQKGRYASAWPAMLAGDVTEYATRLRERGYYTAPLDSYARLLRLKHEQWMRSTAFDDALADVLEASEAETQPEIRLDQLEPPAPIVHPRVPLGRPTLDDPSLDEDDDDEPPPIAA
jgi:hypothetical protein